MFSHKYIIVKEDERDSNKTYTGPLWEKSNMTCPTLVRGLPRDSLYTYSGKRRAENIAQILTKNSSITFLVVPYINEI
jgi:hypothetical protein